MYLCEKKNLSFLKSIIFPPIENEKLNSLKIDRDSIKYITFYSSTLDIINIIVKNIADFPKPEEIDDNTWNETTIEKRMSYLSITEMTAGVGGNVLSFANYFHTVKAIEIDFKRFCFLQNNISLYGHNNVVCYCTDSLQLIFSDISIKHDIIFFDPPWGGTDYKKHSKLHLLFGEQEIEQICFRILKENIAKSVFVKLPLNYDFDYFIQCMKQFRNEKYLIDRMAIMVIKNY